MSLRPPASLLLPVRTISVILLSLIGASSCSEGSLLGTNANVRRVDGRPTPERRTSLERIRNDLYNYIDGGHLDFRVTPEPPLSFAFPSAYYRYNVNHIGDAVSKIGLEVDVATFEPFSRAPLVLSPDAKTPSAEARDSNMRSLLISMESNYYRDGEDYLKRGVFRQPPIMAERSREAGAYSGYRLITYRPVGDKLLSDEKIILIGSLDIANTSLYAIPVDPERSLVQHISCFKGSPTCRASSVYSGRIVDVVFDKTLFSQATNLAQRSKDLLDRHRV